MKDQLEDFIRNNREAFDDRDAPDGIWPRVEKEVFGRPSLWNSVTLWRAAAVVFMVATGWLWVSGQQPADAGKTVWNEFQSVEQFYNQQISHKFNLIDELAAHDGVNGFTSDFRQLEAMYEVLKEEMRVRPSKKVKDALVLNLLVRIDLLNKHLEDLEQKNEAKKRSDQSV